MPIRKKKESREQKRLMRGSTRQGTVIRPRLPIWPFLVGIGGAVLVIVAALLIGSYLKAESDAYRQNVEEGNWTLDMSVAIPTPVDVPDIRARQITPGESVGGYSHKGIIIALRGSDGILRFASSVAKTAGLAMADEPKSLAAEVLRLKNAGKRVTVTFAVTSLSETDTATATYLRGLELALLREYAEAGMDKRFFWISYETQFLDLIIEPYVPAPRCLLKSINGLLKLAYLLSFLRIDKTIRLYHVYILI